MRFYDQGDAFEYKSYNYVRLVLNDCKTHAVQNYRRNSVVKLQQRCNLIQFMTGERVRILYMPYY